MITHLQANNKTTTYSIELGQSRFLIKLKWGEVIIMRNSMIFYLGMIFKTFKRCLPQILLRIAELTYKDKVKISVIIIHK